MIAVSHRICLNAEFHSIFQLTEKIKVFHMISWLFNQKMKILTETSTDMSAFLRNDTQILHQHPCNSCTMHCSQNSDIL